MTFIINDKIEEPVIITANGESLRIKGGGKIADRVEELVENSVEKGKVKPLVFLDRLYIICEKEGWNLIAY